MPQFKIFLISALFLITINLKSSDALKCYRCHGCEDLSNESVETCEGTTTTTDAAEEEQQSGIAGVDVLKDSKELVDRNRPEDGTWWCYSERMKHGADEHTVRDCTNDQNYCSTTTNTNCVQCSTEGCNAASSIIISSLTLTAMLVITRFLY